MRKIVISGSMSLLGKIKSIANQLTEMGYTVVIPDEVEWESIPRDDYATSLRRRLQYPASFMLSSMS